MPDVPQPPTPASVPPPPPVARRRFRPWFFILHISIFAALLVGVVIPWMQGLSQQRYELDETIAQSSIVSESTTQRMQNESEIVDVENDTIAETGLLPEENVIQFIEAIEALGDEFDVEERISFNSADRAVRSGIAEIPVTIQVDGTWENTFRFFAAVEEEDFYLNPLTFDVRQFSETQDKQNVVLFATSFWIPAQ